MYEYRVSLIGNYWDFNVRVGCDTEELGNCSDEARELVIKDTWESYPDLVNRAQEITVTLLLEDEEIELEG